jgi:hypothetical protein
MSEQHTLPRILVLLCSALSAQQPTPYLFKTLVSTGANIGGTTLASSAVIDGIALSDTGDVAFVARWPEGAKERTAVFTSRHFIARDGDTLDGKFLTRINATALAINNEGQVAFEALYGNPGQTGIFIGRKSRLENGDCGSGKACHSAFRCNDGEQFDHSARSTRAQDSSLFTEGASAARFPHRRHRSKRSVAPAENATAAAGTANPAAASQIGTCHTGARLHPTRIPLSARLAGGRHNVGAYSIPFFRCPGKSPDL